MKYRAFISYSHVDAKWARWLHRAIESYRLPPNLRAAAGGGSAQLRPIFRDRDELPSTADLSSAVNEALRESEALIVVCSPRAAESQWVNEEIRSYRSLGRGERIFCYVIDGEPGAGDASECFPAALTVPDSEFGAIHEPVAADARPQGDGRKNAMLKIVAGMLGVGFDALRQRDLRRRQRRMAFVTGGSLVVAAITILLAVTAIIARNEANLRRSQAEDLVDFMLGDLQEQLRELGRLDVFQSVGDKALEYFAAQRKTDDTAYTMMQRARNLRQIGEIRMEQGDLSAALEAFNESLQVVERLTVIHEADSNAQIGLANSLFYVGYVHLQRGELQQARRYFEQVVPIVNDVSAREPRNTQWLIERAYAYTNLGRVLELEDSLEEALAAYRGVMEVNKRLADLEPENTEWKLELGFAHNNVGKVVTALGDLDVAESHYRTDVAIKEKVFSSNTGHNVWRSYLAVSQYYLGQLLVAKGADEDAEKNLASALDHFLFLKKIDPDRKRWDVRRANIERELGIIFGRRGDSVRSSEHFDSSIDTLDESLRGDAQNAKWRRDLARSLLVSADFESRRGGLAVATEKLAKVETHIDALIKQEPANRETRQLSVYADVCIAQVKMYNDREASLAHWRSARQKLDQHFGTSTDPRILHLKAVVLAQLGQKDEARDIQERLRAMGYQSRAT